MSILKQILSNTSHWQVNKDFAKAYGLETAILMTDLIDKWCYFGFIEWFFNTSENILENTTLSYHKQKKCLEILEREGFIETSLRGTPARLHFRIDENKILNFFNSSFQKILKLDLEKVENINKNKEIIINNNSNSEQVKKIENCKYYEIPFIKWTKEHFKDSIQDAREKRKADKERPNFPVEMLTAFFSYWSEPDARGKMRFQSQKTWATANRLVTWEQRDKN